MTIIAAKSEVNLKVTILDLIEKSRDMCLIINENKIKYMILLCKDQNQMELVVGQMRFKRVETFK